MADEEEKPKEKELKLGDFLVSLDAFVKGLENRVSNIESALWRMKNSI